MLAVDDCKAKVLQCLRWTKIKRKGDKLSLFVGYSHSLMLSHMNKDRLCPSTRANLVVCNVALLSHAT